MQNDNSAPFVGQSKLYICHNCLEIEKVILDLQIKKENVGIQIKKKKIID